MRIDPRYFRPTEVEQLLGDPAKARAKLGWCHKISFKQLVVEMVQSDLTLYQQPWRNDTARGAADRLLAGHALHG